MVPHNTSACLYWSIEISVTCTSMFIFFIKGGCMRKKVDLQLRLEGDDSG